MKQLLFVGMLISSITSLGSVSTINTIPSGNTIRYQCCKCGHPDSLYYPTPDSLATTYDPKDKLSDKLHTKIFKWYNKEKWSKLERLFADSINGGWPPANGGYNTYTVTITKGETFDRYQSTLNTSTTVNGDPLLTGSFFSPVIDGKSFPYSMRALPAPEDSAALYYKIEVLQDLTFPGQSATIIPWFGQQGNGIQEHWNIPMDGKYNKSLTQLAQEGYIRITIVDSPNGKYDYLEGKTIP